MPFSPAISNPFSTAVLLILTALPLLQIYKLFLPFLTSLALYLYVAPMLCVAALVTVAQRQPLLLHALYLGAE
jgi:hypothetical protein